MYIARAQISNVKCFRNISLDFRASDPTKEESGVRRWTALLGENGLGKSTLLQALAIPLVGPGAIRELLPVAEGWVRHGASFGEINAELVWHEGDAQTPHWPKKSPYELHYLVTGEDPSLLPDTLPEAFRPTIPLVLDWAGYGNRKEREKVSKSFGRLKQTAYAEGKPGWLACGYGPFRRLTGGSQDADRILYSRRKAARFVTLFREDAALTSATEWLISLHNTARDGDPASEAALTQVRRAFERDLLLERADLVVDARNARLSLAGRPPVPFTSLSDGYRSMLALGIDLLRWLIDAFPESGAPLAEHGVVLVDELDAHLHPRWQQRIGSWLLDKFPKLQFIVATHSPFLAQLATGAGGNVLLEDRDGEVMARNDLQSVGTWRADQVLTEIFGLRTTRAPGVQEALENYYLLGQQKRAGTLPRDKVEEFEQLELQFGEMPAALEDSALRDMATSLRRAVVRKRQRLNALK